jgi:hypothetical protein
VRAVKRKEEEEEDEKEEEEEERCFPTTGSIFRNE